MWEIRRSGLCWHDGWTHSPDLPMLRLRMIPNGVSENHLNGKRRTHNAAIVRGQLDISQYHDFGCLVVQCINLVDVVCSGLETYPRFPMCFRDCWCSEVSCYREITYTFARNQVLTFSAMDWATWINHRAFFVIPLSKVKRGLFSGRVSGLSSSNHPLFYWGRNVLIPSDVFRRHDQHKIVNWLVVLTRRGVSYPIMRLTNLVTVLILSSYFVQNKIYKISGLIISNVEVLAFIYSMALGGVKDD